MVNLDESTDLRELEEGKRGKKWICHVEIC